MYPQVSCSNCKELVSSGDKNEADLDCNIEGQECEIPKLNPDCLKALIVRGELITMGALVGKEYILKAYNVDEKTYDRMRAIEYHFRDKAALKKKEAEKKAALTQGR